MPNIAGQKLWNRRHLKLLAGQATTVEHGLAQVRHNIDPSFKQAVQVIPLPPLDAWIGIQLGAQPTDTEVEFINVTDADLEVDVLFWEPHTVVGPGDADEYITAEPPGPVEPVDICGANDCEAIAGTTRTRRMLNRLLRRASTNSRWSGLLTQFAPLLAGRISSPL